MDFNFLKEGLSMSLQIDYLLYLQHLRELLGNHVSAFFQFITMFGEVLIPISVVAIIYWCADKRIGIFILFTHAYSTLINVLLKMSACVYRPWIIDDRIKPLATKMAYGYSFPSGHSAGAVAIWGTLAYVLRRHKIYCTLLIILVLLVAFSRNFLGVHTPQDVIVSLVLGAFIIFFTNRILLWVDRGKNRDIILFLFSIFFTFLAMFYVFNKSYPIDYLNGQILVDSAILVKKSASNFGYAIGIFLGWLVERHFINFDEKKGAVAYKIVKSALGLLILLFLLNFTQEPLQNLLGTTCGKFANFFSMGFFITAFYPFMFKIFDNFKCKMKK